jgi:translocation and assembly module TamB
MRRRHLVLLVSVFTLMVAVFVSAIIVGFGVGTDSGRDEVRAFVQQQLAGRVKGKIHLGKVSGGLLAGFSIDTFAIRDDNDSLLISTGRVTLAYDPRDLMDKRLLLRNVRVEHPYVRLRQYPEGDWNFQRILKSNRRGAPNVPGRSFGDYVMLDSVTVNDGTIIMTRPWQPDDTLRGAKRDSAIRRNLADTIREIRRVPNGFTHTYRWTDLDAFFPHMRLADPDSDRFGQEFVAERFRVDEQEPPFLFRNSRGVARRLGDSVWADVAHLELPGSKGRAKAKVWWGGGKPIQLDLHVHADTVSMSDISWIYPTLPSTGGGHSDIWIHNNPANLNGLAYALTRMDVHSVRSHLTGAMTFVTGGPVLEVRDVDLVAQPVNFDLMRQFAGGPFPEDWQGDLVGTVKGPGGPLTHFVVASSDFTFYDAHVRGAVSRFSGNGEVDILFPSLTKFHGFNVVAQSVDLRTIQYLFPSFLRLGGKVFGSATLDSSWLDVRFSHADLTHRNGPGEPTHLTGAGRVTWGEAFMTYDMALNAEPLSLTSVSRDYPLGLSGLLTGPVHFKGIVDDLQMNLDLRGSAGRITYNGRVDAYPLSVAAHGTGRIEGLDLSQLLGTVAMPSTSLTGAYELAIRGDTNDIATLTRTSSLALETSQWDGVAVFPSRIRAHFADRKAYVDQLRLESVAGTVAANGALGLDAGTVDSLSYSVVVDSLGGLRRYISPVTSTLPQGVAVSADSMAGTLAVQGVVTGSIRSLRTRGEISGANLYATRNNGRVLIGSFNLDDVTHAPTGTLALRLDTLQLGGIALDTIGATVRLGAGQTGSFTFGALEQNGVRIAATGDLSYPAAPAGALTALTLRTLSIATDGSAWTLAGPGTIQMRGRVTGIDSLVLRNGHGGRVAVGGQIPDSGAASFALTADSLPLADVASIMQVKTRLAGWSSVRVIGRGAFDAPILEARATLDGVTYGGLNIERAVATASYDARRADVALDLARHGRVTIHARGSLPMELRYFGARLTDDSLRATVRTDSAYFDIVEALIPGLHDATGRLVANLDMAGTWKHPDVTGEVRVENGEVTVNALGIRARGVQLEMALFGHSDSLSIRRATAWSGSSPADSVSLRGYVAYRELDNPYFGLTLQAHSFHALDLRTLARLDVSTESSGLRLRGPLRGATLTGGLIVDRGTIFLPDPELARKQYADLNSVDVTTTDVSADVLPEPPSTLIESLLLDGVRVTLGDEVWLRSNEANIKLGGTLNVQRSRDPRRQGLAIGSRDAGDTLTYRLALDGTLLAERGTYTLNLLYGFQRDFRVESGTVTFFGSSELPPELNIQAVHTVKRANSTDLRIVVRLRGSITNPSVTLESGESYQIATSDLVSYLIFGVQSFELSAQDTRTAQLAAQTLIPTGQAVLSNQLRGLIGSWSDYIQLRPGALDAQKFSAGQRSDAVLNFVYTTRVGSEIQLSDNVFMSVSAGLCQLNPSNQGTTNELLDFANGLSGQLQYRFSPTTSIKAGREPPASSLYCSKSGISGRAFVPTPSQWGFSLLKSWRF